MDTFRFESNENLKTLRATVTSVETSLTEAWAKIDDLKEDLKTQKSINEAQQLEIDELKEDVIKLNELLAIEKEKNTALENYTRRENLKFMNIPENEGENSKELITDIIENELGINTTFMRFFAVHRIGKPQPERNRPIIAIFVCREDKERVWSQKKQLKNSRRFEDVYITLDYAREIQEERKVLIKAMERAKDQGIQCKVIDRHLIIGQETYMANNLPPNLIAE